MNQAKLYAETRLMIKRHQIFKYEKLATTKLEKEAWKDMQTKNTKELEEVKKYVK